MPRSAPASATAARIPPMPSRSGAKRGFFFTVLALVILSFIFISIQLWAQAQTAAENRAAERFRAEALQTALSMVSTETFTKFVNASAIYAINKLATSLEEQPDCAIRGIPYNTGPFSAFPDGTYYVNASIYELMSGGSTSAYLYSDSTGLYFYQSPPTNLTYTGDERKYSLGNFFNQTRAAVSMLGYDVQWGEVENFTFNQTDAWTMQVHFRVSMNFTDSRRLVNINRLMEIKLSVPVDGFTDPSVLRGDLKHRDSTCSDLTCPNGQLLTAMTARPHRNVYRGIDAGTGALVIDNSIDAQAVLLRSGDEGLGWFFGPVSEEPDTSFSFDSSTYNLTAIRSYIFMTSNADEALAQSGYFGGIILTTPSGLDTVSYTRGNCLYTNYSQNNCLFCLAWQTVNDSTCPAVVPQHVIPETIPIDPYIPYIQTDGTPAFIPTHTNYRTGLYEALIDNKVNATDMCGPTFGPSERNCYSDNPPGPGRLMNKFSSVSQSKLWDNTGPRDMALCGFYVRSTYGPSYTQRFTNFWPNLDAATGSYSRQNQGIESFVLGKWAGGADDTCAQAPNSPIETFSRVDYQFYSNDLTGLTCSGPYVKGMPGCKQLDHCASEGPLKNATGRFAFCIANSDPTVTPSPAQRYATTELTYVPPSNQGFQVCK